MNTTEFGKRVLQVREELLNMNQSDLAAEINTTQVLLSRVERGIGGNINIVFDLINFLNSNGFQGHMLLREPFEIDLLSNKESLVITSEMLLEIIAELKDSANRDHEKLDLLLKAFKK